MAPRICEVEVEVVVSECVAQRWFQYFNTREANTKDLPLSGGLKLWDIELYAEFWKKILIKSTRRLSKEPIIVRLRHLEHRTETLELYLMNSHLKNLNIVWISVISSSVILCKMDLLGELSYVMKNGSNTATLTPRNSGSVPVNLRKSSL